MTTTTTPPATTTSSEQSQADQILAWLQEGRTLTPLQALQEFGCLRLGARILDLKKRGYKIESKLVKVNGGARVAQYFLPGEEVMF